MNTDLVRMFLWLLSSKEFFLIRRNCSGQITCIKDGGKPVGFRMSLNNSFYVGTGWKDYKLTYNDAATIKMRTRE